MLEDVSEDAKLKQETGNWKLETGNWKLETGNWKLETGNWKLETGNCYFFVEPVSDRYVTRFRLISQIVA
jgi:hypothetical protein